MKVKIHASSSTDVSKAMREYVEKAAHVLEESKMIPEDASVSCTIRVDKKEKRCKVIVSSKMYTARAETISNDFYESVDTSFEKIKKSLRKLKDKYESNHRREDGLKAIGAKKRKEEKKEKPLIAREKCIDAVAMSTESAVTQLETLDYDFFLYLNKETLDPCLVYYRRDNSIGLLHLQPLGSH